MTQEVKHLERANWLVFSRGGKKDHCDYFNGAQACFYYTIYSKRHQRKTTMIASSCYNVPLAAHCGRWWKSWKCQSRSGRVRVLCLTAKWLHFCQSGFELLLVTLLLICGLFYSVPMLVHLYLQATLQPTSTPVPAFILFHQCLLCAWMGGGGWGSVIVSVNSALCFLLMLLKLLFSFFQFAPPPRG